MSTQNYEYTPRGIRWPRWLAKIASKSTEESLRDDLEVLAKTTDHAIGVVDEAKVGLDDPRMIKYGAENLLFAVVDSDGRQTWLGVDPADGGPSPWAVRMLTEKFGVSTMTEEGILFAVLDNHLMYTDFTLRESDGQVPDWVMDRWAPRIAARIGGGTGAGLALGDRYLNEDGNLVPAFPDTKNITSWGSSTFDVAGPVFADAFASVGAVFHNEAKSAERSEHIAARMGSVPALLTVDGGSIPESGAVTVTSSNMPASTGLKPFEGTLAGVVGVLSSTGTTITFTRSTPGDPVQVPADTAFIPTVGAASRQHVTLINMGKNNMATVGAHTKVIEQTNASFAYLSPLIKRGLIVGHFVDSDQTVGSIQYNNVVATNQALKARYGDLYFDLRAYLASEQLWVDTGITPTPADLQQQADGIKPDSVSVNAGHLNAAGNRAMVNAIFKHMSTLGWN